MKLNKIILLEEIRWRDKCWRVWAFQTHTVYNSIKILKDFKIITERFQNPINSVSINSSFFAMKIKEPKKFIIYKD